MLVERIVRIMFILIIIILQISTKSYQNAFTFPKLHSLCSKLSTVLITFPLLQPKYNTAVAILL